MYRFQRGIAALAICLERRRGQELRSYPRAMVGGPGILPVDVGDAEADLSVGENDDVALSGPIRTGRGRFADQNRVCLLFEKTGGVPRPLQGCWSDNLRGAKVKGVSEVLQFAVVIEGCGTFYSESQLLHERDFFFANIATE